MTFSTCSVFSYGSIGPRAVVQTRVCLTHDELDKGMGDALNDCDLSGTATSTSDDSNDIPIATATPIKKLGTMQLAVIVFYTVSGGPFGVEETVRAGGAFYALLGFAIFPLVWSIPEALVTAELGAAYPEASGTVAWVEEAYGPFWGWLQGCLTWFSGVTDNAIYPVLFLDYALQMFHNDQDLDGVTRFILLSTTCLVLTYINYRGLDIVGDMSMTICVLSMSPFVVFCIVGLFKLDPSRWLQKPDPTVDSIDEATGAGLISTATMGGIMWRPYLNNLFWNLNSFDSASCFAGEINNPGRAFPRAMFGGVLLVMVSYLLPLLVALGTTTATQSDWVDGYMATVVSDTVGPWLGAWVVFAAGISNLAMFMSEMSSDAFQILGLAERGYLPKAFAKRSPYGTPTWGLVVGAAVILAMSVTDLSSLIEMLNFNYSLSLLLEYCAFVKLRISHPNLARPYRIPLNTFGCILLIIPPLFFTTVIMMLASYVTYIYAAGTVIASLVIYRFRTRDAIVVSSYDMVEIHDVEAVIADDNEPDPAPPPPGLPEIT
jgi:amino acid transporter